MGDERRVRVLVTNDDGIASPGLTALAVAVQQAGHDTLVVAPTEDRSGSSASLGRVVPKNRLSVRPVDMTEGPERVEACTMDAPPGLIVMAAVRGAFGDPPDVVVSGINLGPNTGHAILHSGTVGAVLTAQDFGASGLADGHPTLTSLAGLSVVEPGQVVRRPEAISARLTAPAANRS